MPENKWHPKSVIKATDDSINIWEDVAEDAPINSEAVLGELLTSKGAPTKGLKSWRLKQKAGLGYESFREVLLFLLEKRIVEIK